MMKRYASLFDYEREAAEILAKGAYGYYRSGADDEVTLKRNRTDFNRYVIRPRLMVDVSHRSMNVSALGLNVQVPIGIAPVAAQRMAHPDGEIASAKAAEQHSTIMICSTISTTSLEDLSQNTPNLPKWFQLYIYKDRALTERLVQRIEKCPDFKAIVLTVDTPYFGKRRADVTNNFGIPAHLKMANFKEHTSANTNFSAYIKEMFDPSLTWTDVKWLTNLTSLPIIVKGVLTARDSALALEHGAKGIIVSNHGGRQLDSAPSAIESIAEVAKAAKTRGCYDVFMDGGIRTGTDVFKALALGAKMVFIGRPILWGLTCNGQQGVFDTIEILRSELDSMMGLAGCKDISDIKKADIVDRFTCHQSKI